MTNETDIGAELYALVKAEFERRIAADRTLGRLSAMKDADEYAHKVGTHLAAALAKYLKPEALPDGKLYYNIAEKVLAPTLRENHRLINDACAKVQELLDERQGLKLRPQRGEYPEERVHELINAASHAEEWSKTESILTDSVRTLTDSFYAENVRANADFRSRAGLSVEIVREGSSKCCQWCAGLVGRYAYPNEVPKDVYRRHDNCTCSVTYVNGRDRQNVWTKARWTASAERAVRLEKAENAEKPVRFTREQARELEKRLTGGAYGGIIGKDGNVSDSNSLLLIEDSERQRIRHDIIPKMNTTDIAPRQSIHRQGTSEYETRRQILQQKGQYGPPYLTISDEELQRLVDEFKGTGRIKINKRGEWDSIETIVKNDRIVGVVVNNLTGDEAPTSVFKIHYGKNGIHIVPDYPSKKGLI